MAKRATMNDIALAAGVSQATVSLVLNEVPNARVSDEVRARIRACADDLGYALKGAGRAEAGRLIGMLIDDVTSTPFAAPFLEGARAEAARAGVAGGRRLHRRGCADRGSGAAVFQASGAIGVLYTTLVTRLAALPAAPAPDAGDPGQLP